MTLRRRVVLLVLALALLVVAISRPNAVMTLPSQHETVILAMDVSGSMRATDHGLNAATDEYVDLAAAGMGLLKPLDAAPVEGSFRSPIAIHIADRTACPLFLGRHIRGLANGPSPPWLRRWGPFLPVPGPDTRTIPGSVDMLAAAP